MTEIERYASGSAPRCRTLSATSASASPPLATRTTAEKSLASRIAVATTNALACSGDDGYVFFIVVTPFSRDECRPGPALSDQCRSRGFEDHVDSFIRRGKEGVWSTATDRIVAFMRSAIKRCVFGLIIRSSSASRYQVGFVFQAGAGTGSGCTSPRSAAARRGTTRSAPPCILRESFAKLSSGIQMNPSASGASWGLRMRFSR